MGRQNKGEIDLDLRHDAEQKCRAQHDRLLEYALDHWWYSNWATLATLKVGNIRENRNRDKLALIVAIAWLQMGRNGEASDFVRIAEEWGVDARWAAQFLASGVHRHLARIALAYGDGHRSSKHFNEASILCWGRTGQSRKYENELATVLCPSSSLIESETWSACHENGESNAFRIVSREIYNLGEAWSGNTVNTAIFRHHAILTFGHRQYTAFYVDDHTLRLVERDLESKIIKVKDLVGTYNLRDAHNVISIGIDRRGFLHLCYDHHVTRLRYRRSILPKSIEEWTDELPMTRGDETNITYPTFILPYNGNPLTFLYRNGKHDRGAALIKTYDEDTLSWRDHPLPILCGMNQRPWTSNAYWNTPATGKDGSLHLSFVWRTHLLGEDQFINNINIGYACSYDNGVSWWTSKVRPYRIPITQVNAEVIYPVGPAENLINQCGMALDSKNRPHIVFYSNDHNGIPQYQHLWFDGERWRHSIISNRTRSFNLTGAGTLQIPISRPSVIVDGYDNLYVIARGDFSNNRMTITRLIAPEYDFNQACVRVLFDGDVGYAEPIIDYTRWNESGVLSMLIQYNEQPNHDVGHQPDMSDVAIMDVLFESNYESED